LTQPQLDAPAVVTLTETESIILLEMPGLVVAGDSTEGSAVAAANTRYRGLVQDREANADRYSCGEAQTLPVLCKHREVQSGSSVMVSQESQASSWDMFDSYGSRGQEGGQGEEEVLLGSVLPGGQPVATGGVAMVETRLCIFNAQYHVTCQLRCLILLLRPIDKGSFSSYAV
jgi:hypothetical protein